MRWEKRETGMIVCKVLKQEQMIEKKEEEEEAEAEKVEKYRRIGGSGEAFETGRDKKNTQMHLGIELAAQPRAVC